MKRLVIIGVLLIIAGLLVYGKKFKSTGSEVTLTEANFDEVVLGSKQLVMVDFWATWCKNCLMMDPIVEELANDYNGKMVVGKLDIDKNLAIANKYNIKSYPTILFFIDGKSVYQRIGFISKEEINKKIQSLLNESN